MQHTHDPVLAVVSIVIAIFASYTALDLARSVAGARGRARLAWLAGGSFAMGFGIWSMHFVAMLAFRLEGVVIAYDVPLVLLSLGVAIAASSVALLLVGRATVTPSTWVAGGLLMGSAIAGMHYVGIGAMRMPARYTWIGWRVGASIGIAVVASFVALQLAFRFRADSSRRARNLRAGGGVVMGLAISGMHYTAIHAMRFTPGPPVSLARETVFATSGLAAMVVAVTALILGIALTGSIVERALVRREAVAEKVTRILESITDAFYSVDRQWRFTYVNRAAQDFLMPRVVGPKVMLGRTLWDALPDVRGTPFEVAYLDAMSSGRPAHLEAFHAPSGRYLEAHAHPSREGLAVYLRDVTDRKQTELALREAVQSRDDFLSIASHELKTPLTSLKLQTQVRQRDVARERWEAFAPERLRTMFASDARQLERLSRLIDDMLDISRIATGKLSIRREPFDFRAAVDEIVERFRGPHAAAGSTITFHDGPPVEGRWDRYRIEQVITNLLTNAIRYGAGKPVDLRVARVDGRVRLAIRDRGIGIAEADQARIFERFERAVSASDRAGLGLGLFISRQIVEMHGGTIRVESRLGEGSTFTVELPLDEAVRREGGPPRGGDDLRTGSEPPPPP